MRRIVRSPPFPIVGSEIAGNSNHLRISKLLEMIGELSYATPCICGWVVSRKIKTALLCCSWSNCSAINVLPEFQINVNNDQGVKLRKGEMVERSEKVKVVGVLKEIVQPNALTFWYPKKEVWKVYITFAVTCTSKASPANSPSSMKGSLLGSPAHQPHLAFLFWPVRISELFIIIFADYHTWH